MNPHSIKSEEAEALFKTNEKEGISEAEAKARLEKYGENRLAEKKKKSIFMRFLVQLKDFMIIILLLAAAVSFFMAAYEGNASAYIEPLLILLIVVLNAAFGVFQESRAERALDALKEMSAAKARVIRDGKERTIDARLLVPGDIIRLEAGDLVPADARLIASAALSANESALTGESVSAEKNAVAVLSESTPLAERVNMLYSGTSVTNGTAAAVVTATGKNTEIGKIAKLLEGTKEKPTPLQEELEKLGKYLGIAALISCAVIFAIGIFNKIPPKEMFMTSVSLAVSAIPEGLAAIVTIILSMGVSKLAKQNVIVKRLTAVETLGCASVICTDKTGTITQNKMTIKEVYADGDFQTTDFGENMADDIKKLLSLAVLCCNASVEVGENGEEERIGDPSETAIISAALSLGIKKNELEKKCPRVFELPFDSDRKRMSVIVRFEEKFLVIVKGAAENMVRLCSRGGDDGVGAADDMGRRALRVIAVAYKIQDEMPKNLSMESIEDDLVFFGEVGMADPPREGVAEAVEEVHFAGVATVMMTGDQGFTATAIGREVGIFPADKYAGVGDALDIVKRCGEKIPNLERTTVYSRVSPENKLQIVEGWQDAGYVVAVTGDGVNDAPALKAADIGCAMGITGTEAAKGAADIILADDNFVSIVNAIRLGRGIYANIQKVVGYLLATNFGEILTVLAAMLLWRETPLISVQLLWINLITDSLPAIALGAEEPDYDIMDRLPRIRGTSILANGIGAQIALMGPVFAFLTLMGYALGKAAAGISGGQTLAFMVLARMQIIHSYNMRNTTSLFDSKILGNKKLNLAALISHILIYALIFTPLGKLFGFVRLPFRIYAYAWVLSIFPILFMEIFKFFNKKHEHNLELDRNIKKKQSDPNRFGR